ncbi:MAG: BlaI/MecI/CopY family transcriptional regulator [Prevotella sp.]|nr:BlaI/MecI/CopY family transcriptional regulator [Prevotella sp.]
MNGKKQSQLTKAETQVMNALWSLPAEGASSSEIMEQMPEPKPAPTTLLTFLKILKEKGFVATEKMGKALRFTPMMSRDQYTRQYMTEVKNSFFGGSFASLVSFFAKDEQLTKEDLEELEKIIQSQKAK